MGSSSRVRAFPARAGAATSEPVSSGRQGMSASASVRHPELLVVNPNTNAAVTALIDRQVRRALPGSATARTRAVDWGTPSIETRIDAAIAAVALLDALSRETGMHGVLVAAFGDPGLLAARELLDMPVVGIGEAALAQASDLGSFAILTIQPASVPLVRELVRANRCEDRCLGIEAVPVSVLDAASPDAVRDRLAEFGLRLTRSLQVDSVVLGGAPLGVHAEDLSDLLRVPCIDPMAAGIARLASIVSEKASGHRDPAYGHLQRKPFEGRFSFLEHLNKALWP